jgi:tetratricopeptide (TPR) repeat protein
MPDPDANSEREYYQALDHLAEGNAHAATLGFRAAIAADPDFLDARHGLIRALQDAGQYDEAIAAAFELAARAPEDVLAHTALSILYQHKGMIPEAEVEATKAKLLDWKLQLRASREPGGVA